MSYHYTAIRVVKSRPLTTLSAGEDVEQQELSFTAGGMKNGTATLEDTWTVSYKNKYTLKKLSNHASWYLPKGAEIKTCMWIFIVA